MAEKTMDLSQLKSMLESGREPNGSRGAVKLNPDNSVELIGSTMEALRKEIGKEFKPVLTEIISEVAQAESERLDAALAETAKELRALADEVRPIEIKVGRKKAKKVDGIVHSNFEDLLRAVSLSLPVLMVGPAGTGKTHSAEAVADALGLNFHSISVGSQTSKSDLQGYMTATGEYIRTQFRDAFEKGGLFLLDEADAGNSNVLILLNAALSNKYMAFPDGMVKAHENFRLVATANTYGHGASRQYVGRNQLDAATLDRFVTIDWPIDAKVEASLAGKQTAWLAVVRSVRARVVEELQLRAVVSPRATQRGATLLEGGLPFEQVLTMALTGNIQASEKPEIEALARNVWEKHHS